MTEALAKINLQELIPHKTEKNMPVDGRLDGHAGLSAGLCRQRKVQREKTGKITQIAEKGRP